MLHASLFFTVLQFKSTVVGVFCTIWGHRQRTPDHGKDSQRMSP